MRIISGTLRGRDLGAVPDGVRPTSDRVRESLFASLGDVAGCAVLDLFAGTGALGLEAYSRGASRVVFVERSRRVMRSLRERIARLGLAEDANARENERAIELVEAPARRALRRLAGGRAFDLVLLDPPYEEARGAGELEATLEALFASELLTPAARVVVEGPRRHPVPPLPGIRATDERRYGDTLLTWLERSGADRR